jgi:hypothetical protein
MTFPIGYRSNMEKFFLPNKDFCKKNGECYAQTKLIKNI